MSIHTEIIFALVLTFVCTLTLIPIIKKIAIKIGLMDKPNKRKVHHRPVPLIGGLSIAVCSMLVILLCPSFGRNIQEHIPFLGAALLLLLTGTVDDKMNIKPIYRLIIQFGCSFVVVSSGIKIDSLFGILGIHVLNIYVQYILSMVVIVGVVNSINLMDGIDGLAGGFAVVSLSTLSGFFYMTAQYDYLILNISLLGAVLGFLRFNLSSNKIFLGDGGSLFLGFFLIVSGIKMIEVDAVTDQTAQPFILATTISLFLLPVLDSLRVYFTRIKNGTSPFKADKTHLHHLVLLVGLNHKLAAVVILVSSLILVVTSLILINYFSLLSTILICSAIFILLANVLTMNKDMLYWKNHMDIVEGKNQIGKQKD